MMSERGDGLWGFCGGEHGLMGWGGGLMGGLTMLLVVVFLVMGIIYFRREINKKK